MTGLVAPPHVGRWWAYPALLAIGTFAVGTDAFVIAGLLPQVGASLHVGPGAAGQLVSVFSISYAVLSPALAVITARWPRGRALTVALCVLAVGNVATVVAPRYALVLAARVVAAAGAAMFTGNAGVTAAQLAGEERRGRAIAIVTVGLTSSLAFGAPLGTLVGHAFGWRATMLAIAVLAVLVVPVIAWRMPPVPGAGAAGLRDRLRPLADVKVLRVLVVTFVAFVGVFLPYTYLTVILAAAIDGHTGRIAALLLVFGVAGTAGNLAAGRLADRLDPARVVTLAALALAAVMAALLECRHSFAACLPAVAACGVASWSFTAPQQHRIMTIAAPGTESVAISLNFAVAYLGISVSSVLGAVTLHVSSAAWLPALAAVLALATAALARGLRDDSTADSGPGSQVIHRV